jgi:hypothetical protein
MNYPTIAGLLTAAALFSGTAGCERKEKVLDVETPGGGIEIQRDKDSGDIDIKVEDKK